MFTSPKLRAPFQMARGTRDKLPAQRRSTPLSQRVTTLGAMVTSHRTSAFGPALLQGLAELGPVAPFSGDLSLELGVSIWLRHSGISLAEARRQLLEIRRVLVAVCGLDPVSEPIPLVGRCLRLDVVNLVAYLADLLRRGAARGGLSPTEVAEQVVTALPGRSAEALGA